MVTPMLYEKRILNGEEIVVIFKPEGVAYAKEKYPKLNLYSIREIEAFEGLEVLEQKMLHDAKNHDYATAENPYKNLEGVSRIGIEPWRGIVTRLMDKFERVEQYCSNGELAIKSEGMEDTFKDIAVYSTLAMILFRKSENLKELQGKSGLQWMINTMVMNHLCIQ